MITSKAKSRIVGVTLGEVHLNFIKAGIPPITANFALVRDDEEYCGIVERRFEWSEKTMKALAALQSAMEEDELEHLFEPQPPAAAAADPEQV